ncbi:MAG: hypothetical protein A2Y24_06785 [Clostridiales bacterium GWE2_32_10]|nr:MAG: hypothetical protein A2Y24_06785 [Clostridiales bacterium GWE2_32_10]HBY19958.1 hypothetical protein [Clostridiales bacterium]
MDIKKELSNYNTYKAKIIMLELKRNELYDIYLTLGGGGYDGVPTKTTFKQSKIEKQAVKIVEERDKIEKDLREYERKIKLLDSLIRVLDENKRIIVTERFINGKKIVDIAVGMRKDVTTIAKAIEKSIIMLNSIKIP